MAKPTRRRRSAQPRRPEHTRPGKRPRAQTAHKGSQQQPSQQPPSQPPQQSQRPREPQDGARQPSKSVAPLTETAAVNPFEPMERLMEAFMPMAWLRPWIVESNVPKFEILERNGALVIRAEVPGVEKTQLAVEASDVAVTIKGTVQHGERQAAPGSYRASESRESFERTVRLPSDVDSARAKATFKDGVLEVVLPKVDRSRPHPVKF